MKAQLKRSVLLVLAACDGLPMPESALLMGVKMNARPAYPTLADEQEALRDCEAEGYCIGVTDEFSKERSWTLTEKGEHKARQLR